TGEFFILEKGETRELTLSSQDEYKLYIVVPVVDGFAPISNVYSSEAFSNLIINVIENLSSDKDSQNIEVILNAETLRALEEAILAGLKEKMLNGVTLRANDNFDGGFRIAKKDGDAYYDYSTEAVVEMLSNYLSPKVTKLLKEAE
ncbi:MAG: hypothetical protein IIX30_02185, partial [Clostridia bacterium]|nr:hypothetical protein [Clostridia bacterium]